MLYKYVFIAVKLNHWHAAPMTRSAWICLWHLLTLAFNIATWILPAYGHLGLVVMQHMEILSSSVVHNMKCQMLLKSQVFFQCQLNIVC